MNRKKKKKKKKKKKRTRRRTRRKNYDHLHIRHDAVQRLCHHPVCLFTAQFFTELRSLSLSYVVNFMLLATDPGYLE